MKNRMAFFNGRALFVGLGLSHILKMSGTSFWISCVLGTILGAIILGLVKKTNNYKFFKVITGFLLALLSCSILVNLGHSLYLDNTPILVLTFTAVLGSYVISKSESENLKKVCHIFYIYSMFLFICKFLCLQPHINLDNLLPAFNTSFANIMWCSLAFAITGVVPILGLNEMEKEDKKNIILTYLVSMITVSSIAFMIVTVMGVKEASLYRYPEYVVLKRIHLLDFISNVDNIFTFAIVADLLFTMAAGFKTIGATGKFTRLIAPALITTIASIMCFQNWPMILLYDHLPIALIFLLILILFPKKKVNKINQN